MANIQKCNHWLAPSSSGGKVWGYPVSSAGVDINVTFNGTYSRFKRGNVTVNNIKSSLQYALYSKKERDGYTMQGTVWVDLDSGELYGDDPTQPSITNSLQREFSPIQTESFIAIKSDGAFNF